MSQLAAPHRAARNSPFVSLPCACGAGDSPAKAEQLLGPLENRKEPSIRVASACPFYARGHTSEDLACPPKKHAQNGRGFERPAPRASVFLSSLAARLRALCACGASDAAAKAEPLLGPLRNRNDPGGLRSLKRKGHPPVPPNRARFAQVRQKQRARMRAAILAKDTPFGSLPRPCGAGDSPAKAEQLLSPLQNRNDSGHLRLSGAQRAPNRAAKRTQEPSLYGREIRAASASPFCASSSKATCPHARGHTGEELAIWQPSDAKLAILQSASAVSAAKLIQKHKANLAPLPSAIETVASLKGKRA
jgi:hypothetical protein